MTPKLPHAQQRRQIVEAARALSADGGLYDWTLDTVAQQVGITRPGVNYYFYSAMGLRMEIIVEAIRREDVGIVIQAIAKFDPLVDKLSPALRKKAADYITK